MAAPVDRLDELVRLTVIQLRREVPSQSAMILELSRVGFTGARIAEILGTTTATVAKDLQRAKAAAKKSAKPAKKTT